VQGIVPFAQHTKSSAPPENSLTLFAGVRLFLQPIAVQPSGRARVEIRVEVQVDVDSGT